MNEYETEPVRGLPEELPEGEQIIWQGEPSWQGLARRAFHVRAIAVYFGLLIAGHLITRLYDGGTIFEAVSGAVGLALLGAAAVAVLGLMAWLYSKTTVYTITNRRLVVRFGVAIPMMINIPWGKIEAVGAKLYRDRTGDIVFTPVAGERLSYWVIWPHARPWHFSRAQPMLRCIPDAEGIAARLGDVFESEPVATPAPLRHASQPERAAGQPGIRTAAAS